MEDIPPKGTALSAAGSRDVAAVQRLGDVPAILEVICRVTGLGFAAVARVTAQRWIACAVRDEIDFGMVAGDELDINTTICDEVRGHRSPIVIDNVCEDPIYRDHHTPRMYGFRSYISVPIVRGNDAFFGTLFAMDMVPAKLANSSASLTFNLFAQLIALQLDADERRQAGVA